MIDSLWLILPFITLSAISVQTGYNILFESQAIDAIEQASIAVAYTDQDGQNEDSELNNTATEIFRIMSNSMAVSEHQTTTNKQLEDSYLKYRVDGQSLMTELIWFNRMRDSASPEKPVLLGKSVAGSLPSGTPGHYIFAIDTGNGYGPVVSQDDIDDYVFKWSEDIINSGGRVTILPFNKMVFVENNNAPTPSSNSNLKKGYCVSNLVRKGLMYDIAFSKWTNAGVLTNMRYNDDFGPNERGAIHNNLVALYGDSMGSMLDEQQYPYVADSNINQPYDPAPSTTRYKSSTLGNPSSPFLSTSADEDIDYEKTVSFINLTEEEEPSSTIRNKFGMAIDISDPSDGSQNSLNHPFVPYYGLSSACYGTNESLVRDYGKINLVDGTIENTQDINAIKNALLAHEPIHNSMSHPTSLSEGFIRSVQVAYKYSINDEPTTIVMIAPPQSNQGYAGVDKKLFEEFDLCEKVKYINSKAEVILLANNSSMDMGISIAECVNSYFPGNAVRPDSWDNFITQHLNGAGGGDIGIIGR